MDKTLQVIAVDSLQKIFPESDIPHRPLASISGLRGERVSFQIALQLQASHPEKIIIDIQSKLKPYIQLFSVEMVPVLYTGQGEGEYISTHPGVFPDRLAPILDNVITMRTSYWQSIWVDISLPVHLAARCYDINFYFTTPDHQTLNMVYLSCELIHAILPKQNFIYTQWLYTDCLANYYQMEVFSKEYWQATENFVKASHQYGVNMMLTPLFTPPLYTQKGEERRTVQLVDVTYEKGSFSFEFKKLDRWIRMLLRNGIEWIEFSHLFTPFTQNGTIAAPKIMANVYGKQQQIFGWDTDALSDKYLTFLQAFLHALRQQLIKWDVLSRCYFHLSDAPPIHQLDHYQFLVDTLKEELQGLPIIDAIPSYDFYQKNHSHMPVAATDAIANFLKNHSSNLWAYYTGAQQNKVSNRLIAMPSSRNRVIGIPFYKYHIKGFMHWGMNFYNVPFSSQTLDPYIINDGYGIFPAGDAFSFYPAPHTKQAIPSIRAAVFYQALCDMRALQLLESLTSRSYVMSLLESEEGPITFDQYPSGDLFLLNLRKKVHQNIKRRIV